MQVTMFAIEFESTASRVSGHLSTVSLRHICMQGKLVKHNHSIGFCRNLLPDWVVRTTGSRKESRAKVVRVDGWFQLVLQISRCGNRSSEAELSFWKFYHSWFCLDVRQWLYSSRTQWNWSSGRLYNFMI